MRLVHLAATAAVLLVGSGALHAQSVALTGMMGSKPLLVVNGSAPRAVAVGETFQGVRVLSSAGDHATLQADGKRFTLRVGDAPVNAGSVAAREPAANAGPGGRRVVLTAGSGGHFFTPGQINGRATQFVVDTGATVISMSVADAERLGVNYKAGRPVRTQTANGVADGWLVKLNSVRVGSVEVYDVDAVVHPVGTSVILLGNSFLNRFTMARNGDQMVLEKRY